MKEVCRPMTVHEVVLELSKKGKNCHRTTVYRNLEGMVQSGDLVEVVLDSEAIYYERVGTHHHHIVCEQCERITCLVDHIVESGFSRLERILRRKGFSDIDHQMFFTAVCRRCS